MFVYRIDRQKRAQETLSGKGAELYGGRWNYPGTLAVYCAGSRSLALLEMLVHLDLQKQFPPDRIIVEINIPKEVSIEYLDPSQLDQGWRNFPYSGETQSVFTNFVKKEKGAVLAVPSVVIPQELNFIINPLHPEIKKVTVKQTTPLKLDQRLWSV